MDASLSQDLRSRWRGGRDLLILIDAFNLAYWCGSPPSLRLPLSLMAALLARGDGALAYFDANARYRFEHESAVYEELRQHAQIFIEAPSGRRADGEMLKRARASGGCIVTRDRFRDYRRRYRKLIDDPARVFSGTVYNDRVGVPALAIEAPLALSADEAWRWLQTALSSRTGQQG